MGLEVYQAQIEQRFAPPISAANSGGGIKHFSDSSKEPNEINKKELHHHIPNSATGSANPPPSDPPDDSNTNKTSRKLENPYINMSQEDKDNALIEHSKRGNLEEVKLAFSAGADPAANDNEAIRLAAPSGHLNVLKFLDGKPGVDFSARDNQTAIFTAFYGQLHVLEFLDGKPGVDFSADDNLAAIFAADNEHLHVLLFLKSRGVDLDSLGINLEDVYKEVINSDKKFSLKGLDLSDFRTNMRRFRFFRPELIRKFNIEDSYGPRGLILRLIKMGAKGTPDLSQTGITRKELREARKEGL